MTYVYRSEKLKTINWSSYLFAPPIAWHIPSDEKLLVSWQVWPDLGLLTLSPLPGRTVMN